MVGIVSLTTQTVTISEYEVLITPSTVGVQSPNGSATSPLITATVNGGAGPFEYLWQIDNVNISITPNNTEVTRLGAGGYNDAVDGVLTCTVTDTGNGNAETQSNIPVFFIFGDLA